MGCADDQVALYAEQGNLRESRLTVGERSDRRESAIWPFRMG